MRISMQNPLVSIGVPTYCRPDLLKDALNAVLTQTYTNIEIIVSDNATPGAQGEEVERVLSEYASRDSRLSFFRQNENIGAINNFQFVKDKAKGSLFMWASDDDILYPHHIETLVEEHKKGDYILVASNQESRIRETGGLVRTQELSSHIFSCTPKEQIRNFLYMCHYGGKANIIYGLYNRDSMPDWPHRPAHLENELLKIGIDILFLYDVLSRGRVKYLEQVTWCRGEREYPGPGLFKRVLRKVFPKMCSLLAKRAITQREALYKTAIEHYHAYLYDILIRAGFSSVEASIATEHSKADISLMLKTSSL